jgi:bifunctional ADP-heptose synthase (sugar kinase/adenylyltransferase)
MPRRLSGRDATSWSRPTSLASGGRAVRRVPAVPVQARDVCGAGDTVLATLGVALARGGTISDGCR